MSSKTVGAFGEHMNVLARALTATPTPAANSLLPVSALFDGDPGASFRFGSLTDAPKVVFHTDLLLDYGSFETISGFPVGWINASTGSSTIVRDTAELVDGVSSARFDSSGGGGAGVASAFVDVEVRAGQRLKIFSSLRGDAGVGRMELTVRNQNTGSYLVSAGGGLAVWQAGQDELHVKSGAAWDSQTFIFTMESFAQCGGPTTILRFQLLNPNNATSSYADAIYLLPGVTFASVHGHNIDPRCGLTVDSAPENITWTTRGTFAANKPKPSMYVTFSVIYERFWRLMFSGTNAAATGPILMGEAVLTDHLAFTRGPLYPFRRTSRAPQIRIARQVGGPAIVGHGTMEQATIPLSFRCSAAERPEFLNEVWRRSMTGAPGVIVPNTDHPEVHFGVLSEEYPEEWPAKNYLDYSTTLEELALPLITG